MKIKVEKASGVTLDWLVAKCEGFTDYDPDTEKMLPPRKEDGWVNLYEYPYSTRWSLGGPIIELEGIDLYCNVPFGIAQKYKDWTTSWRARYCRCGCGTEMMHGPTPLIAAMRCYVALKLGEEAEVPDELLNQL